MRHTRCRPRHNLPQLSAAKATCHLVDPHNEALGQAVPRQAGPACSLRRLRDHRCARARLMSPAPGRRHAAHADGCCVCAPCETDQARPSGGSFGQRISIVLAMRIRPCHHLRRVLPSPRRVYSTDARQLALRAQCTEPAERYNGARPEACSHDSLVLASPRRSVLYPKRFQRRNAPCAVPRSAGRWCAPMLAQNWHAGFRASLTAHFCYITEHCLPRCGLRLEQLICSTSQKLACPGHAAIPHC